jgi:DNA-binding FadR family transcriptional regulator
MPLQTVEPQRLYRQIAEQVRALIASGEFATGTAFPQNAIWPSSSA